MCKLSIVMPVYNTEKFLHRSIDSIIAQTFTDWELILINDGSKDNSGSICDEYAKKDPRIRALHKENGGAGSARNKGLEVAQGKYVVFPDSDDWIERDAYEYCVDKMDSHDLDMMVFGSINTIYDERNQMVKEHMGRIVPCYYRTQDECRENWATLMQTQPMGGPSDKIYRMSIIRENHLCFPDLRRMQDGVFNMYYYDHITSFAAADRYFYHFTMHPSDYQKKKIPKDYIVCAVTFHKTAMDLLEKWDHKTKENERIIGDWFTETIIGAQTDYLPHGEHTSFEEVYRHISSINNHPYVHNFYRRYSQIHKLRKMEVAIKNRWNFVLTLSALRFVR